MMESEARYDRNRHPLMRFCIYLFVAVIALFLLTLVVWSFATLWPFPDLVPSQWNLDGYWEMLFGDKDFSEVVLTSLGITTAVCVLSAVVATLAAQAFAFYDFPGKNLLDFLVYLPCMVPAVTFAIGIHILFMRWGLDGTVIGVIIPQVALGMPYAIRIITDATRVLGNKFTEAAIVLGSSPIKAYFQVSLRMMAPSIISAMCMVFTVSFNDYFLTFLLGKGQIKTFAVTLFPMISGSNANLSAVCGVIYICAGMLFFFALEFVARAITKRQRLYLV